MTCAICEKRIKGNKFTTIKDVGGTHHTVHVECEKETGGRLPDAIYYGDAKS